MIPPVLNLLAHALGFAGAPNLHAVTAPAAGRAAGDTDLRAGAGRDRRQSNWTMISSAWALGVGLIVLDEVLGL